MEGEDVDGRGGEGGNGWMRRRQMWLKWIWWRERWRS